MNAKGPPSEGLSRSSSGKPGVSSVRFRRFLSLFALAWSLVVAASLAVNLAHHAEQALSLTAQTARALLEKDLLYRDWNILHGSVYVPKTEQQPWFAPSVEEEREIRTQSGRELTLLNPTRVSRQIFALHDGRIEVESAPEMGTTFRIFLPVNENGPKENRHR